ncbi:protein IWS1 homolog isoform X2 [Denticeps clupeoides]|uniref:protein IWS1 homolog isoform X2 n=1 Tax=Denticeps clupeoides TaxID=299321 RepID=UPI0010A32795|nr:protein IWS1 homolog isoform X2 [Denticeps clupeoides]
MDGEDELFSGNHSDDGSGTPVQDEHALGSDGEEEMRSEPRHSEDERSDGEGTSKANGVDHSSDREEGKGGDSDSEKEAAGRDSDSEPEPPRPAESDDERAGPASSPKHRGSTSDNEEEPKERRSDSENEGNSKAPSRRSDGASDSENEASTRKKRIESDDDDGEQKDAEREEGGGKWKAVMHSDSEDEDEGRAKARAGSDQEQEEGRSRRALDDSDEDEQPVKRKKAILSDSEDDEEEKVSKKSRRVSDGENSDSDAGSEGPDKSLAAKLRELGSDSEDEEQSGPKREAGKNDEKALFGSDSDSGDEEEKMIADIFGESGDEEEEEFTGFNQEDFEVEKTKGQTTAKQAMAEDSDSDDDINRGGKDMSFMSDFDIMLARKKAQSGKRRRNRDGGTFISDADDVVSAMITKMTEAAEEDRMLNSQKKPALKKLTLLPTVVMHLKKQDLKETFIDSGVMTAIKEWISPLPDKSLPALKIREELLRILQELPSVSQETLKHSGIGRAVMFLYKHPKESRPNKDLALKLINEWSRPIFGLTSNYKGMTREERQQRDLDQQIAPRRRLSEPQKVERAKETDVFAPALSSGGQTPRRDLEKVLTGEEKALRPGDPGFCARARVPMPSNKDYVVRPKWNVDGDSSRRGCRKGISRLEKHKRRFAEQKRQRRPQGAVKISVEGNRMPL